MRRGYRGSSGRLRCALAAAALAALGACGRIGMATPEGFAPLEERRIYRAVSPEGVRLQARWVDNEPRQSTDFWVDALSHQLREEGYAPSGSIGTFRAGDCEGRVLEWLMPYGTETWSYMTGLVVVGKRMLVIEAAGEAGLYGKHRQAIVASLESLRL